MEDLAIRISRRGRLPPFEPLRMDVTSDDSVRDALNHVLQREGRIDVVVNNAGMGIAAAVEDTSVQEAVEQFDVNFFGVLEFAEPSYQSCESNKRVT